MTKNQRQKKLQSQRQETGKWQKKEKGVELQAWNRDVAAEAAPPFFPGAQSGMVAAFYALGPKLAL